MTRRQCIPARLDQYVNHDHPGLFKARLVFKARLLFEEIRYSVLDESGSAGSLSDPPLPLTLEKNLWGLAECVFYGPDVLPVTQPSVAEGNAKH